MKTTVEISDALFHEAKERAHSEGTTLRALIEKGLRRVLDLPSESEFELRRASVGGRGLHADVRDGSWETILERVYKGRGG